MNPDIDDLYSDVVYSARPDKRGELAVRQSREQAARMAELHAVLGGVLDVAAIQSRFPKQPPVGSVLRWERTFPGTEQPYVFVALRIDSRWYVTSNRDRVGVMDWPELQEAIGDHPCFLVIEYKEIPRLPVDPADEIVDPRSWFDTVFPESESK
jgi:hypothetical protein